jgi:poly(ADP-ribose) glycohydrolase ARH3
VITPDGRLYRDKLEDIGMLLNQPSEPEIIIEHLGNASTALNSVPTAIYCFLSHPRSFKEALIFAVSLGGDTDTIAAMTGAISGAYHGRKALPSQWLSDLENGEKGRDYIEDLARALWRLRGNER